MITKEKLQDHLSSWISNYATTHGKSSLIVYVNKDNNASLLTADICAKTRMKTICLAVPYDTTYNNIALESIDFDFAKNKPNVIIYNIDSLIPDYTDHFSDIKTSFEIDLESDIDCHVQFGLLRAFANANNGLIVDCLTADDIFLRTYKKNTVGDLVPLGWIKNTVIDSFFDKPSPPKRGFTAEEIKWAYDENNRSAIIFNSSDPVRHKDWGRYTVRQRQIIAKLNQIDKLTHHKNILSELSDTIICDSVFNL